MYCWVSPFIPKSIRSSTLINVPHRSTSFITSFHSSTKSLKATRINKNQLNSKSVVSASFTTSTPETSSTMNTRNSVLSGDIYQQIFDIDIAEAGGIKAVIEGETYSEEDGYVLVAETANPSKPGKLIQKLVIPEKKMKSYQLAQALFDNYELLSNVEEIITAEERTENEELINFVIDSAPMKLAREYIEQRLGKKFSDNVWFSRIYDTWFKPFPIGSSPDRSGFEHVLLGEAKAGKNTVGGLHWWYFYHSMSDDISYNGAVYRISDPDLGLVVPEVATMTFTWTVNNAGRTSKLRKKIGGFFVGPSVEGMMAMGMVRAASDASTPTTCIIEGMEIDLKMFKSPDGKSINTFFPVLRRVLSGVEPPASWTASDSENVTPVSSSVIVEGDEFRNGDVSGGVGLRIVSALSNPVGDDKGREKITIANLGGNGDVNLRGWKVRGPNKSILTLGDVELQLGEARTFNIPKRGSLQLSNKGGTVELIRPDGEIEISVRYDRADARVQGQILVWDGANKLTIM